MSNIRLTPKEAHTALELQVKLEEYRVAISDYLLLRASLSPSRNEKRAWYILAALVSYVERKHQFPRVPRMVEYLGIVLGDNQVPDLPPLTPIDLIVVGEIADQARSSLKTNPLLKREETCQAGDDSES